MVASGLGVAIVAGDETDTEFQLLEGWMLGVLLFPLAMAEIVRVPPANDAE
jgi:hypothetical protein